MDSDAPDTVIIDSTAIMQYLADKHGQLTFPAGTIQRAQQDSFTCFALDDLDGILWTAAKHSFVLPEEHRVKGVKAACRFDFAESLRVLAERLGNHTYLMGDTFTIADIVVGHCAGWAFNARLGWPKEGPLADYIQRIRQRPAYIRANEIRSQY